METKLRNYPLGIYTFSEIIERNLFYVDKTGYVYDIANKYKYVFLSRPRRFGKSLLVDTLQCYFEGRKQLFAGLKADALEKEWTKYPVLRFDMSSVKSMKVDDVRADLNQMLGKYERLYGKADDEVTFGKRLEGIINRAYAATGQKAVLLIDEYDSPLLNVMHNKEVFAELRDVLRNFYAPIKICDALIRFGFITGITKFSQLSIFSEINNLKTISMMPEYDGICGITKEELLTQCTPDIQALADKLKISYDDAVTRLTENYDGYHFSIGCEGVMTDVFNPFSLINAFNDRQLSQYWFSSGTPSFLLEHIKNVEPGMLEIDGKKCAESDFNVSPELSSSILPVMYQAGYLTIKGYDPTYWEYTLGYPNREVKMGFLGGLLPVVSGAQESVSTAIVRNLYRSLNESRVDDAMLLLKEFCASISYFLSNKKEKDFQTIFYIIISLVGAYTKCEVSLAAGRTDAIVETSHTVYIIEYKLDKTAEDALRQIDEKHYASCYAADKRKIVKVGVNISSESRTIESWKAVEVR